MALADCEMCRVETVIMYLMGVESWYQWLLACAEQLVRQLGGGEDVQPGQRQRPAGAPPQQRIQHGRGACCAPGRGWPQRLPARGISSEPPAC